MSILEVRDLSFSYPDKSILHRLSFSVEKGDFVCVVGTNGTGKSTLLKLILNRLQPTEGEIRLFDQRADKFRDYSRIAYVPQKATSFNRDFPATVEEIVSLGLYSSKGFMKPYNASDREKAASALKRVGIYDYRKSRIGRLSGGQQQRVFIAKALVSSPEIIFLDEPMAGVDIKAVDSICCLLGELNKSDITILMVTHDISSILYHSNKVLVLSEDGHGRMMSSEEFNSGTILNHVYHQH